MSFFSKLKSLIPHRSKPMLSVLGWYMYNYCLKIISDDGLDSKEYIDSYEEWLEDFRKNITYAGKHPCRKDAALIYVEMMQGLDLEFCDELKEIGINKL